jgi:huntingtin
MCSCKGCLLLLLCFISVCDSNGVQTLIDVLLYASHPDPQLRGITSAVIGCLLHAALIQSGGNFQKWIESMCKWSCRTNEISVPELVKLLLKVSPTPF